jgi:hypothetical protein
MSEIKKNLTDLLFNGKTPIKLLGGKNVTAKTGPAGLGLSPLRPASAKGAAKFNGAAYVLDRVIVDTAVNALESIVPVPTVTYVEELRDGKNERMFYTVDEDGANATFDTSCPEGFEALVPVVMFAMSQANADKAVRQELRDLFTKIRDDYASKGIADISDVLQFCDSFYYGFAVKNEEILVFEEAVSAETIKATYTSGILEVMDILEPIAAKPALTVLDGVAVRKANAKKTAGTTGSTSSVFEACKAGEHTLAYEWEESQIDNIPAKEFLDDFVPSEAFYSMLQKIELRLGHVLERMDLGKEGLQAIGKDYINSFVIGKPGTGKTTMAYALGATLHMPVYSIPITKNTEEDTFQGMTKVVNGAFKYVATDFLEAYTHGGIIVLEEVNLADPSVIMGALGQAVEAPFMLQMDGYKKVRRHPLCVIMGTMNIGTYGAKGVSQAFSSRFKQTYTLNDPKAEDFIGILQSQGHAAKRCKWVYDAYTKINNFLKSPEISREEICLNVTLRGCLGALECMEEGDTPQQALYNTLIGKIAEVDLELAEDVYKSIVKSLPNLTL